MPINKTPARIVPLIAASSPPDPSSLSALEDLASSFSSLLDLGLKNHRRLLGGGGGERRRDCWFFFVCLREEHGLRKWNRLKEEEEEVKVNNGREEDLRVRVRLRIFQAALTMMIELKLLLLFSIQKVLSVG